MALNSPSSSSPSPSVDVVIDERCYWIHNALAISEQIKIVRDILQRCQQNISMVDGHEPRRLCMNPTPKTLVLGGDKQPTLRFGGFHDANNSGESSQPETVSIQNDGPSLSLSSVYNDLILQRIMPLIFTRYIANTAAVASDPYYFYDRYSVGVIRYDATSQGTSCFPEHIDHCNDPNGWVVLLSLGCTAQFSVRITATTTQQILELQSGDVVVLDPSTKAAVRHGVLSILPYTCPKELVQAFDGSQALENYRYGVQCRTSKSNAKAEERVEEEPYHRNNETENWRLQVSYNIETPIRVAPPSHR